MNQLQQTHSEVRIATKNKNEIQELINTHEFEHVRIAPNNDHIDVVVDGQQAADLKKSGIDHEILIPDLVAYYSTRNAMSQADMQKLEKQMQKKYKTKIFGFGSNLGFYTVAELEKKLDSLRSQFPKLISKRKSIGESIEKRHIWMVKISNKPDIDQNKPQVLYTALHHAREPQGMAVLMYFICYLLENYGKDAAVTDLVNKLELYFVPVVNPDGYEYNSNRKKWPEGGMWRANRHNFGNGNYGVDLNRNYDAHWSDIAANGQKKVPNIKGNFPGTHPFSEPETQAIRDLCLHHDFKMALNYHSYTDELLFPWAGPIYSYLDYPENIIYSQYAVQLTEDNHFDWGQAWQAIYAANGDSDGWMYRRKAIYAFSPEVGKLGYNFSASKLQALASTTKSLKKKGIPQNIVDKLKSLGAVYGVGNAKETLKQTLGVDLYNKYGKQILDGTYDSQICDGFWPHLERIFPLADDNLCANLKLAQLALNDSKPEYLSVDAVAQTVKLFNNDFFCVENSTTKKWANPKGEGVPNKFSSVKGTVTSDRATGTGLMWQQTIPNTTYSLEDVLKDTHNEVHNMNALKIGKHDGWRLPTLEEAMTLLIPKKNTNGEYVDHRFDKLVSTWTTDLLDASRAWVVHFEGGYCAPSQPNDKNRVLLVRNIRKFNLRKKPNKSLSVQDVENMLKKRHYFALDYGWNRAYVDPQGKTFAHDYQLIEKNSIMVVKDHVTGLMWQKDGSDGFAGTNNYRDANAYITKLNRDKYAGYDDWRLPTLEEMMSLMESEKNPQTNLYLDPIFNPKQEFPWTADSFNAGRAWFVAFNYAVCNHDDIHTTTNKHVRAVRTAKFIRKVH